MSANRINRINEEVKRELSEILRDLKDPRIPMMTSVVTVNVTNDLRYAKVFVSVLGDETVKKDAIAGLKPVSYTHLDVYKRQVLACGTLVLCRLLW